MKLIDVVEAPERLFKFSTLNLLVVTDSESPYTSTHTKTFSSTEEDTQNLVDDSTSKNHTTPMTLKW